MDTQDNKDQIRITEILDTISVIWHKKHRVLSVLTRHGLIHIFPERIGNTTTIIQTRTNTGHTKRRHMDFLGCGINDVYESTLTGYSPNEEDSGMHTHE